MLKNIVGILHLLAVSAVLVRAQQPTENTSTNPLPVIAEDKSEICIFGRVKMASIIPFENRITLMQAIKNAGGALPDIESNGNL
jgi:hypothetical protein